MAKQTWIVLAFIGSVGTAAAVYGARRPHDEQSPAPAASLPGVTQHTVRAPQLPRAVAPKVEQVAPVLVEPDARREAGEPAAGKTQEEVLFEFEQHFDGQKQDVVAQLRNERMVRETFERLGAKDAIARDLECRGSQCRAVVAFKNAEQKKALLNGLIQDPEAQKANLGFNVIPETEGSTDRYVLYLSAGPPLE